jgi:hypothetical protein
LILIGAIVAVCSCGDVAARGKCAEHTSLPGSHICPQNPGGVPHRGSRTVPGGAPPWPRAGSAASAVAGRDRGSRAVARRCPAVAEVRGPLPCGRRT